MSQPSGRVQQARREQLHMSECESFIKLYLCLQSQLSSVSPSHRPVQWHSVWGQRGDTDRRRGLGTADCIPARLRPDLPGQTQPAAALRRKREGEYERERCSIFILFPTFLSVKRLTLFNIVLAAAVSAACSLQVIIPQHPAPVIRKCNVLCSPRDTALPVSPPPGCRHKYWSGAGAAFLGITIREPVFK